MTTTYPHWVFDDSPIDDPEGYGERAVRFFNALRHPNSERPDKRLELAPFWERIIRRIYGPRDANGKRLVRTVYIQAPRGSRKTTTIGGGLGLYHAVGHEKRPRGQVCLGAGSEKQAEFAWAEALAMVRATPALRKALKVRGDYIEHPASESRLKLLTVDGDFGQGDTPAAVFLDELHVYRNRRLWRAMKSGLPKVPGSLMVITTTPGRGQTGLAWEEYNYARRIALGEIQNPAYLPIIFEPESGSDWKDETVWYHTNPGLSLGFPDIEELRHAARQAEEKPAERDDFKQYNIGFWLDQSTSPFVPMDVYDEGADEPVCNKVTGEVNLDTVKDAPCWLGVDLSTNVDLSAIVACWRIDEEDDPTFVVWPWFFCPKDNLRARGESDQVNYPDWVEKGFIIATDGNVIDHRKVKAKVRELCQTFNVQEIAFDPKLAIAMMSDLAEEGLPAVEMRQGWISMGAPIKALERAILGRKFKHGGHPVLRWHFDCVALDNSKTDTPTFHKGKSRDRIDGAQACAMAVGRAAVGDAKPRSPYESSGWCFA